MVSLRLLTPERWRLPYEAVSCGKGHPVHTHAEALERPQSGWCGTAEVRTSWCPQCARHFHWASDEEMISVEEQADWPLAISPDDFRVRVRQEYGEPGVYAAESVCLCESDYLLGYEHCVERIAPALEEELAAAGGDPPEDPFGGGEPERSPEAILADFLIQ